MPTIRLPGVLDPATGGRRRVDVAGGTLGEALADLCRQLPTLSVHLFDERGELRRHVNCIHDGITRRRLDHPIADGDEVVILQAVSGGEAGHDRDAGSLAEWVAGIQAALRGEADATVPCDGCTACCTSSQFVAVGPDEVDTLAHIPDELLFPAPLLPKGHMVMGYDKRGHCPMLVDGACSIYAHRPRTCRTYDCRIFAATGVDPVGAPGDVAHAAVRWRFDDADPGLREALRSAAIYVSERAGELPTQPGPMSPTRQAVLAVRVHPAFLGGEPEPADVIALMPGGAVTWRRT